MSHDDIPVLKPITVDVSESLAKLAGLAGSRDTREVDIKLDITVSVECDYVPGFPATRECAPELGGYVPKAVYWSGVDITSALDADELARIERSLNRE